MVTKNNLKKFKLKNDIIIFFFPLGVTINSYFFFLVAQEIELARHLLIDKNDSEYQLLLDSRKLDSDSLFLQKKMKKSSQVFFIILINYFIFLLL